MIRLSPRPHKNLPYNKPITDEQSLREEQSVPKAFWTQTSEERPDFRDRNVSIDRAGHTMPAQSFKQYVMDIVSMENTIHKRKEELFSICQQLGLSPRVWESVYDECQLKDVLVYDEGKPNIIMDLTPTQVKEAVEIHLNDVQDRRARRKIDNDRLIPRIDGLYNKHGIRQSGQVVYDELKGGMN